MHINSRNTMRLRSMYFQSVVRKVIDARTESWDKVCKSLLEDNNYILNKDNIAFTFEGDCYPESALSQYKKSTVNRKAGKLAEELEDQFTDLRDLYVEKWDTALRNFKNMLTTLFREAVTVHDLQKVIPLHLLENSEDLDYVPLPSAKGISDERAEEIRNQYVKAFAVEQYIATGKLL